MKPTIEQINNQSAESKSLDITNANIEQLKHIFPDVFSEGKVDFDALKAALGEVVEDSDERYNFTWNGKNRARQIAQTPSTGTLRPCKEDSVNWDSTENLFIEGDNLEVLKLLQKSYHKKVKMIYIDPPYNTGKDFVYKDNFRDNIKNYLKQTGQVDSEGNKFSTNSDTSGRYHSDWLSMIYPRLKLSRNLLKDDGVIFISIDDNELANLKSMADEIFGEDNFIGTFVINSTPNARDYGHIGKMHEYVLFYAKNISNCETFHLPELDKKFKYEDDKGGFNIHPLYNSNVAFNKANRPNLYYPFYVSTSEKDENGFFKLFLEGGEDRVEVYPPLSQKEQTQFVWRWGKPKAIDNLNIEIIGYKTASGEYRVVQKMRHDSKVIRSLLIDKDVSSRRGTAEVEELFGRKVFSFPKPRNLITKFLQASSDDNDLILDFFAGSGTTGHSVIDLNIADEKKRRFILIQLPEIIEDEEFKNLAKLTMERLRKVCDSSDHGVKYFKLDETNIRRWDADFDELAPALQLAAKSIKDSRTAEDVLYEILLKYGIELTTPIEEDTVEGKQVFVVGAGALIVCLDDDITEAVVEGIAALIDELEPESTQVVFKDEGFANDDNVKTNAVQILKQHGVEDVKSI